MIPWSRPRIWSRWQPLVQLGGGTRPFWPQRGLCVTWPMRKGGGSSCLFLLVFLLLLVLVPVLLAGSRWCWIFEVVCSLCVYSGHAFGWIWRLHKSELLLRTCKFFENTGKVVKCSMNFFFQVLSRFRDPTFFLVLWAFGAPDPPQKGNFGCLNFAMFPRSHGCFFWEDFVWLRLDGCFCGEQNCPPGSLFYVVKMVLGPLCFSSIFCVTQQHFEKLSERNPHYPNNPNICAVHPISVAFLPTAKNWPTFPEGFPLHPLVTGLHPLSVDAATQLPAELSLAAGHGQQAYAGRFFGFGGGTWRSKAEWRVCGFVFCDGNVILPDIRVLLLGGGFKMFCRLRTFIPRTWENEFGPFFSMGLKPPIGTPFFRKLQRTGLSEVCWLILPAWLPASEIPQTSW